MFGYYLRLSLNACRRDPGFTGLIVFAIGLGIGVCVMTLTLYHAMASNPIRWKSDRLYAVTMDSWPADRPENSELPDLPPPQLTFTDATYLFNSDIPERKVLMYPVTAVAMSQDASKRSRITTRVTTADFFAAFDVPFSYGSGWNAQADSGPEPVIVLSHGSNEMMFGGANSVGRTMRWNGGEFRIVGVLAQWLPQPKFYDVTTGSFNEPEAAYVPWGWGKALQLRNNGSTRCWKAQSEDTFENLMGSECVWVQMWVELEGPAERQRMQDFIDTYWAAQHAAGRFERPRNNRLSNVGQWLEERQVVRSDDRLLVVLAFVFLGVCLLNTMGFMLSKFLSGASVAGVRRALGAGRGHIFAQHLVLCGVLALAGSLLGLVLDALFLRGIRALYGGDPGGYQALAHFDTLSIIWALGLAAVAIAATGIYPAWRICRVAPARYLQSL